ARKSRGDNQFSVEDYKAFAAIGSHILRGRRPAENSESLVLGRKQGLQCGNRVQRELARAELQMSNTVPIEVHALEPGLTIDATRSNEWCQHFIYAIRQP